MDFLGIEITPSFVYKVDLLQGFKNEMGYCVYFDISFKDGNKHRVEDSFNAFWSNQFNGWLIRDRDIDKRKVRNVLSRADKSKNKLMLLRSRLILEMKL